jgi:2-polyprenyl-3-methyl-5-hydroxy-6-metoxy-1,4-benzoquinol methylase
MVKKILAKLKWFKKKIRWNQKYRNGSWDYMVNEKERYNTIVSFIKETKIPNASILDLGCGYGALNTYLKPSDFGSCLGIDISSTAIDRAIESNFINSNFQQADIHQFETTQKFDVIIFNEVLYYLDNQIEVVAKYSKFFNEEGYFIFSFYGVREDLIKELEHAYILVKKEIISQSESVVWGICMFKNK